MQLGLVTLSTATATVLESPTELFTESAHYVIQSALARQVKAHTNNFL